MLAVEQVAALLQGAGLGTMGKDLFVYQMPLTCRRGLVLMTEATGNRIDHELPGWERCSFQLVARAPAINTGLQVIRPASNALTWSAPRTLAAFDAYPAILVKRCLPRHTPIIYPRSDADLYELSVNFDYVACPV